MKILLVYPNRYRLLSPPPIGLSMVARSAREAGHDVRLLDLMWVDDPEAELARALQEEQPELVGFNLRNIDNQDIREPRLFVDEYARLVAMADEVAPTVVGGTALYAMPEEVFDRVGATWGLVGEGVRSFVPGSIEIPGALGGALITSTVPEALGPTAPNWSSGTTVHIQCSPRVVWPGSTDVASMAASSPSTVQE